jgi:hypothetical protein
MTRDVAAMNVAAVGSVPKVSSAILAQKPDAKLKTLDELLENQNQGKLGDTLRKQCR